MDSNWILVSAFTLQLILFYPEVKTTGIIEINFIGFSNPTGKLFDGFCCDYKNFWSYDCAPCDHQFVVCLGNISKSSDMNSCEFGKRTTGKLKSNQIEFTNDIGGVANPMKVKFDKWPGLMKLKINTLDKDGLNTFDFIDHYEYQYFSPVLNNSMNMIPLFLNLTGTSTSLMLELSVYCDEFSFGPTCDVICIPRDNDEGHFFCDQETGEQRCLKGWSGDNCVNNTDDCEENQCQSDATCQDGIDAYTCLCPIGRTGQYCEGEINECASLPCLNGGQCYDGMASFTCSCSANFAGKRCEKVVTACDSQPCLNNATCYSESVDHYNCSCPLGLLGKHCEINQDECASNPCQNGATCIDQFNGFKCLCFTGYFGIMCEMDIDECKSNPCQNGGICQDLPSSFECLCPPGTTGKNCEIDINECTSDPCSGNGTCSNILGSFNCSCFPGFTGEHCDLVDPCYSSPCQNNGSCFRLDSKVAGIDYGCECTSGFNGTFCDVDVDECAEGNEAGEAVCRNGGICINVLGSFQCECLFGFKGISCEETEIESTVEFESYSEQSTTESSEVVSMSEIDENVRTDVTGFTSLDITNAVTDYFTTKTTTISYSGTPETDSEAKTSDPNFSTQNLEIDTTEVETKKEQTFEPTLNLTERFTTPQTSTKLHRTSKTAAPAVTSTDVSTPISNTATVWTTLTDEYTTANSQENFGQFFQNIDDFVVIEEAHEPVVLTTKRPIVEIVTDCVLIKIFGTNDPEEKLEKNGAKKEICWLVYGSIPPPLADIDITITQNKEEAFKWIVRTIESLTPVAPRLISVGKESQKFFKEFYMFLGAFSRYRSTRSDDTTTLNSRCLQVLIKTKRKGRGYFKNKPNNPNVRYIRKFKSLPRSLASKMVLCKINNSLITTTTPVFRTVTNRNSVLLTKLQTSTRPPAGITNRMRTFKIIIRNLNNTHFQKQFHYPQRGLVRVTSNVLRPKLVVTVFRSARKVFEAGTEKARKAYRETKILLHNTLRQLSTLWTTVHRMSNAMFIPVAYSREIITKMWNNAWVKAQGAYSVARGVIHRAYQQARENFRRVYDTLKSQADHLSNRYYQLYRDFYKEYTNQVSKAAQTFSKTYDRYEFYLTEYWKKYIKGDENIIIKKP